LLKAILSHLSDHFIDKGELTSAETLRVLSAIHTLENRFPGVYDLMEGNALKDLHDRLVTEGQKRAKTSSERAKLAFYRITRGSPQPQTRYQVLAQERLAFLNRFGLDSTETF